MTSNCGWEGTSTATQVFVTSTSWGLSSLRLGLLTWHPGTNSQSYLCPRPSSSSPTRMHSPVLRPSPHLPSTASRPPLPVENSREGDPRQRQTKRDMDGEPGEDAVLLPPCRTAAAASWQATRDLGKCLGSGWGSGSEGCCWPTQQSSLSLKSPSWNVSPACHVCALAVLTGCQSTHTQPSERGQRGCTAEWGGQILLLFPQ